MHGRGFACAVGAKKTEDLAALHTQREIAQRRYPLAAEKAAVMLADIVKRKGRSAGHEIRSRITLVEWQSAISDSQRTSPHISLMNADQNKQPRISRIETKIFIRVVSR